MGDDEAVELTGVASSYDWAAEVKAARRLQAGIDAKEPWALAEFENGWTDMAGRYQTTCEPIRATGNEAAIAAACDWFTKRYPVADHGKIVSLQGDAAESDCHVRVQVRGNEVVQDFMGLTTDTRAVVETAQPKVRNVMQPKEGAFKWRPVPSARADRMSSEDVAFFKRVIANVEAANAELKARNEVLQTANAGLGAAVQSLEAELKALRDIAGARSVDQTEKPKIAHNPFHSFPSDPRRLGVQR